MLLVFSGRILFQRLVVVIGVRSRNVFESEVLEVRKNRSCLFLVSSADYPEKVDLVSVAQKVGFLGG
jgi:hypothetical protein